MRKDNSNLHVRDEQDNVSNDTTAALNKDIIIQYDIRMTYKTHAKKSSVVCGPAIYSYLSYNRWDVIYILVYSVAINYAILRLYFHCVYMLIFTLPFCENFVTWAECLVSADHTIPSRSSVFEQIKTTMCTAWGPLRHAVLPDDYLNLSQKRSNSAGKMY